MRINVVDHLLRIGSVQIELIEYVCFRDGLLRFGLEFLTTSQQGDGHDAGDIVCTKSHDRTFLVEWG